MTPKMRGRFRNAAAALLASAVAFSVGFGAIYPAPPLPHSGAVSGPDPLQPVRFSMLAVGDTGQSHWLPQLREGQLAVARALTAADLSRAADALLLLGDNFYPRGLTATELIPRIRTNLVWPYCRFVALDGRDSSAVADACTLPRSLRRASPPAIYAVLGNHDHKDPESPALQADAIPRFVSNWHASVGLVSVVEFPAGVSLVLVDSTTFTREEQIGPVRDALRKSHGPWRIVVAHHPIAALLRSPNMTGVTDRGKPEPSAALLRRAIAEAGVSVHLFLSGHHHNLQGIEMENPSRILHLVAGGGSNVRPIEHLYANRTFALESNGFARIDLTLRDGREVLVAELWSTERYPAFFWREAQRVARWSVSPSSTISREIPQNPFVNRE